ncbi:MAG: M16 family metallopeptidase, partial [Bacillota bacterium]
MRFLRFAMAALAFAASAAAAALPANVERVETFRGVTQYRLKSNGMTLLVVPDASSPVFTFMVVYHVGSRNEAPGNTGSAHLLEHMIFNKSTEHFGRAKGHPTFQEVLYEAGADYSSSNMTTWYDRMTGYSTLPRDKLELAMKIEADRLGRALILDSERQSEMSVVRNEYEIGENNPQQALEKAVVAAAIQAQPYHWETIGYRSDIEGVSTEKLREHYKTFFWPNNAEAILVGDVDVDRALAIFDREFGAFKRSPHAIPKVITVEPPQEGERRVIVRRPATLDLVMLGYMRPGALHPDYIALDVLASILGDGVNSRLHRAIVETGLATHITADNYTLQDPYPLLIKATVAPGKTHREVEDAIKAALASVVEKGVTEDEVNRAQRQIEVTVVRSRDGTYNFASNLGEAVASANWKWFLTYVDEVKRVTAADVQRVAASYVTPEHATVGWFEPSPAGKKPAPAAVAATPAARPAADVEAKDAIAAKPAARPQKRLAFSERTTRTVLPNGVTLDIVENHAVPTVAIRGLVFAGDAAAPPGDRVLPALTARMLWRGTTSRSKEEIGRLLEAVGATRTHTTSLGEAAITANGLSRDLPLLLDILADELQHPAFKPDELQKARDELGNDYRRVDDNTSARALERLARAIYPPMHPYHPANLEEKLASLARIDSHALAEFHRARYNGASLILAIVGDVDARAVAAEVEKRFGTMPRGERLALASERMGAPAHAVREAVT